MRLDLIKELVTLANKLDDMGEHKHADKIDLEIRKTAADWVEEDEFTPKTTNPFQSDNLSEEEVSTLVMLLEKYKSTLSTKDQPNHITQAWQRWQQSKLDELIEAANLLLTDLGTEEDRVYADGRYGDVVMDLPAKD